jgi:hypothetical protein
MAYPSAHAIRTFACIQPDVKRIGQAVGWVAGPRSTGYVAKHVIERAVRAA